MVLRALGLIGVNFEAKLNLRKIILGKRKNRHISKVMSVLFWFFLGIYSRPYMTLTTINL